MWQMNSMKPDILGKSLKVSIRKKMSTKMQESNNWKIILLL